MIRSDLIDRLAERHPHLARKDAEESVEVILEAIMQAVAEGRRVEIRNLGAFSASERRARKVRNPRTGEVLTKSATRQPRFRAGKILNARINLVPQARQNGLESCRPTV